MSKLETNALRIAELMGWIYDYTDQYGEHRYSKGLPSESEKYLIMRFSSYNGLMPIVFECNKSKDFYYPRIYINPQGYDTISIFNYCDSQELSDLVANFDYNRESEPEFIEALQLACIEYLELRNETK